MQPLVDLPEEQLGSSGCDQVLSEQQRESDVRSETGPILSASELDESATLLACTIEKTASNDEPGVTKHTSTPPLKKDPTGFLYALGLAPQP